MQALTHLRTPASRTPGVLPDSALDLGTRLQPTFPTKGLDLFPAPGSQPETSVPVPGRCPDPVLHARAREASQVPGVLLRLPMRAAGVRSPWAERPEAGRVQGEEREGRLGRGAGLLGCPPDQQAPAHPLAPGQGWASARSLGAFQFRSLAGVGPAWSWPQTRADLEPDRSPPPASGSAVKCARVTRGRAHGGHGLMCGCVAHGSSLGPSCPRQASARLW